ncbi:MAG: septum formation initiator family protein [Alloprevotella sp.]|nr:septum formation initiator family protein [Alloprevotella sp.]
MGKKLSKFGSYIWKHKYFWTIALFIVIVCFIDPNSLYHRYQLRERNDQLREEIAQYDEKYAQDSRTLRELQEDQEAVENVARVRLFMKTDNEDVYVIDDEK